MNEVEATKRRNLWGMTMKLVGRQVLAMLGLSNSALVSTLSMLSQLTRQSSKKSLLFGTESVETGNEFPQENEAAAVDAAVVLQDAAVELHVVR